MISKTPYVCTLGQILFAELNRRRTRWNARIVQPWGFSSTTRGESVSSVRGLSSTNRSLVFLCQAAQSKELEYRLVTKHHRLIIQKKIVKQYGISSVARQPPEEVPGKQALASDRLDTCQSFFVDY